MFSKSANSIFKILPHFFRDDFENLTIENLTIENLTIENLTIENLTIENYVPKHEISLL